MAVVRDSPTVRPPLLTPGVGRNFFVSTSSHPVRRDLASETCDNRHTHTPPCRPYGERLRRKDRPSRDLMHASTQAVINIGAQCIHRLLQCINDKNWTIRQLKILAQKSSYPKCVLSINDIYTRNWFLKLIGRRERLTLLDACVHFY